MHVSIVSVKVIFGLERPGENENKYTYYTPPHIKKQVKTKRYKLKQPQYKIHPN